MRKWLKIFSVLAEYADAWNYYQKWKIHTITILTNQKRNEKIIKCEFFFCLSIFWFLEYLWNKRLFCIFRVGAPFLFCYTWPNRLESWRKWEYLFSRRYYLKRLNLLCSTIIFIPKFIFIFFEYVFMNDIQFKIE